jgi:HIP---CoA ligase
MNRSTNSADACTSSDEGLRGDLEFGTIARLVAIAAQMYGDSLAIEDFETKLSFAQLLAEVRRASRALIARGIASGDRVCVWAPNCWQWVVCALTVHSVGAALVPINTRYKGAEAGYVIRKSAARVLFTVCDFLGADYAAYVTHEKREGGDLPSLELVVSLEGAATSGALAWNTFLEEGSGVSEAEAEARALAVEPGDLSDILFTSGTTGHAQGRHVDARADAARVPRLERCGGPPRGRQVPGGAAVLS